MRPLTRMDPVRVQWDTAHSTSEKSGFSSVKNCSTCVDAESSRCTPEETVASETSSETAGILTKLDDGDGDTGGAVSVGPPEMMAAARTA